MADQNDERTGNDAGDDKNPSKSSTSKSSSTGKTSSGKGSSAKSGASGKSGTKAAGAGSSSKSGTAEAKRTADAAAAEARRAADKAKQGAGDVAEEARKVAADVSANASEAARGLASSATEQLHDVAEDRKEQAAERVSRIAQAVDNAAGELDREIPFVGHYVHRTAHELEVVAGEVRERDVSELVDVAKGFARRQPALFAGVTGLLGFAAVRFLMASPSSVEGAQGAAGSSGQRAFGGSADRRSGNPGTEEEALKEALSPDRDTPISGDPGGVAPEAPGFQTEAQEAENERRGG